MLRWKRATVMQPNNARRTVAVVLIACFIHCMFQYLVPICLLSMLAEVHSVFENPARDEDINDQELVFAIAVNRHGNRAPDADELSLSHQQDKIRKLIYIEGPEGLLNSGKRKAYKLGEFYKQRYGPEGLGLISNLYLRDEIAIRSTDKERSKMTIQVAMAAAYPPEPQQQWDDAVGKIWQPIPYQAVPLSEDYLRYYSNCEKFNTLMKEAKNASLQDEFLPFMDLMPLLKEKTGINFTADPLMFQSLLDLYRGTVGLGLTIPEWAKPLLPRFEEAARLAYKLYFRTEDMKMIGGGVLLNTFLSAAEDMIAGKPVSQRLRLFSAHDFNIGAMLEVTRVKGSYGIPDYGSMFALELYRSRSSGEYSVLPVYLAAPDAASSKELIIIGCEKQKYCNFTKFTDLVKQYRLTEKEYYRICNIKTML